MLVQLLSEQSRTMTETFSWTSFTNAFYIDESLTVESDEFRMSDFVNGVLDHTDDIVAAAEDDEYILKVNDGRFIVHERLLMLH